MDRDMITLSKLERKYRFLDRVCPVISVISCVGLFLYVAFFMG